MLFFNGVKKFTVFSPDGIGATGGDLGQTQDLSKDSSTSSGAEPAKTEEFNDDVSKDEVDVSGGKFIPRSRFNEINEKRKKTENEKKELEVKYAELEKSSEGYRRLEGYLSQNRNLHKKVTGLIKSHADGEITEAQLEKELTKIEDKASRDGNTSVSSHSDGQSDVSDIRYNMYNNDLLSRAKKDFETQEEISAFGKRVTRILNSDYPDWKTKYHPGLVDKVYKEAMDDLEFFHQKKMKSYEKKKGDDGGLPRKESPASFHEEVHLESETQRKQSLQSGLASAFSKGV